jgi:hypothetical protein
MPVYDKIAVTINGVTVKVLQGTNDFQDVVARAIHDGALTFGSTPTKMTVTAATQPLVVNPNGSYAFVGGETVTLG